jgi:MFS family permease
MGLMALLIPLAPANQTTGLAFLVVSQLGCDALGGTAMILGGSLRQTLLPQAVLGRVSGAFHAVGGGTMILGALGGGLLGEAIGPRLAMLVTALGLLVAPLIGVLSPLRGVRTMGEPEPA